MGDSEMRVVDRRFNEVDHRFNRLESIVSEVRAETSARFVGVNERIDRLHRTIIYVGGVIASSLILTCGLLVAVTS